jgi:hypothetical protein
VDNETGRKTDGGLTGISQRIMKLLGILSAPRNGDEIIKTKRKIENYGAGRKGLLSL